MSKLKNYGMDINLSLAINNETDYEIGVHLTDSTGIDLDSRAASDSIQNCLDAIMGELIEGYVSQTIEKSAAQAPQPQSLEDEIKSLKADKALLEARLKDQQGKIDQLKTRQAEDYSFKVPAGHPIRYKDLSKDFQVAMDSVQDPLPDISDYLKHILAGL